MLTASSCTISCIFYFIFFMCCDRQTSRLCSYPTCPTDRLVDKIAKCGTRKAVSPTRLLIRGATNKLASFAVGLLHARVCGVRRQESPDCLQRRVDETRQKCRDSCRQQTDSLQIDASDGQCADRLVHIPCGSSVIEQN